MAYMTVLSKDFHILGADWLSFKAPPRTIVIAALKACNKWPDEWAS